MAQRFNWNAPQSEQTEPQNKDWDEFDYVPAQVLNWAWTLIEKNFEGINKGMLIGPNVDEGNLKDPFKVGSGGVYRGGYTEGGVAFYTAFNCKWTGSDWEEVDDTISDPALIAYEVNDVSKLNGVSSGDVGSWNFVLLYASSVDKSGVITWNTAPQVVNTLLLSDSDGDGNRWGLNEQADGDAHISHPDRSQDYVFTQGRPSDPEDVIDKQYADAIPSVPNGNYFDSPIIIASGSGSGTLDVSNNSSLNDGATALLLWARTREFGGSSTPSYVEVKFPSHGTYKRVSEAQGDTNSGDTSDSDLVVVPYAVENGKIDYNIGSPNGEAELRVIGEYA